MTTMTKVQPPVDTEVTDTPGKIRTPASREPGPVTDPRIKASTKSGYARDIRPDLLSAEEAAGNSVPVASESGRQAGRVPPAIRKTPNYKAVDPAEADRLLRGRLKGTIPKIAGGLDEPVVVKPELTQYEDQRMELQDMPEATAQHAHADINDLRDLMAKFKPLLAAMQPVEHVGITTAGVVSRPEPPIPRIKERVQLQIEGAGSYSVPAVDVVRAGFGIFILLPCGPDDATFTPSPGSSVKVSFKNQTYDCYFPGVAGEIPSLQLMILAMIDKPTDK